MFRESFEPDARHVMVIVSPGRGVAMQYRSVRGGETAQAALIEGTAPQWVRLERSGLNTFTGYASRDGTTWQMLASVNIDMSAGTGLVVTSHDNATLATATFESVSFGQR